MFWKFGFGTPSAIDELLKTENFTLEQVLDEEDVLQECKNQNQELTAYLSKEEVIMQMLALVTNEPSPDADLRQQFKYPSIACEVLTADSWSILDALTKPEPLEVFWAVLDRPAPLHPLLASYFSKIAYLLLQKKPEETCEYIQQRPDILDKLLGHLAAPAIMDVLMRVCCTDCGKESPMQQWLCEDMQLLDKIVSLFDPQSDAPESVIRNAAQLLEDLVTYSRKEAMEMQQFATMRPFMTLMQREEVIGRLLDCSLSGDVCRLENGVKVMLALVNEPARNDEEPQPTTIDTARFHGEVDNVLGVIGPRLPEMHNVLASQHSPAIVTAGGPLEAPVGSIRIMLLRLLHALVASSNVAINAHFATLGTAKSCLDLFFNYPDNNFVHRHVANLIIAACQHSQLSDEDSAVKVPNPVVTAFLKDCNLLKRVADAWDACPTGPTQRRPGYLGHMTLIANAIESLRADDEEKFRAFLDPETIEATLAQWASFTEKHLKPQNNIFETILGGKPPTAMFGDDSDDDMLYGGDESRAAELEFHQYLATRISSDLPDTFPFHEVHDESTQQDLVHQYGQDGPFADNIGFDTDLPDVDAAGQEIADWQIVEGPNGPDPMVDEDEWRESVIADDLAAAKMKISVASDSDESDGGDDDDDAFAKSPQGTPQKVVNIPLSPRGAAAVASMPSFDPFAAAPANDGPEEQGWADFGDAPQAMDVSENVEGSDRSEA